jgi:hypothetical protein
MSQERTTIMEIKTELELRPPPAVRHKLSARPGEQPILSIRASIPKTDADRFVADALHDVRAFMQEHHVRPAGPPFSICRARGDNVDVEAGWPTATKPLAGTSRIHTGSLPRGLANCRTDLDRGTTAS